MSCVRSVDFGFNEDATAQFVGLIFDSGVERLVIHNETNGEVGASMTFDIRHLVRMMLMVRITEAEGDCDDSDPNTGPNATEACMTDRSKL